MRCVYLFVTARLGRGPPLQRLKQSSGVLLTDGAGAGAGAGAGGGAGAMYVRSIDVGPLYNGIIPGGPKKTFRTLKPYSC